MGDDLKRIVEAGIQAPSGDNLQPWRFALHESSLSLFVRYTDTRLISDWAGTLISAGAALENMNVAAHALGYTTDITLFPSTTEPKHVADLIFTKTGERGETEFYANIPRRSTNRGKYQTGPLTLDERSTLLHANKDDPRVFLNIVEDHTTMKVLATHLAMSTNLVLSSKTIHDYFVTHVRFSKRDMLATCDGIPISALSLNPFEYVELRYIMRYWSVARFIAYTGAPYLAALAYADKFLRSSAFIAILAKGSGTEDFVRGGRILERLWLTATALGLSIQPIFGAFIGQLSPNELVGYSALSPRLHAQVEFAYLSIRKALRVESHDTIILVLRIGRGRPPRVKSLRKPLENFLV